MTKGEYMESQGMVSTISPEILAEELDEEFEDFVDSMRDFFDADHPDNKEERKER